MRRRVISSPRPSKFRILYKRDAAVEFNALADTTVQTVHFRLEPDKPSKDYVIWTTTTSKYRSDTGRYTTTSDVSAPVSINAEMSVDVETLWISPIYDDVYTEIKNITIQAELLGVTASIKISLSTTPGLGADKDWRASDWTDL